MRRGLICLAALATLAAAPAKVDPGPVVAAERAFAADALKMGIDASFLKNATADAVVIANGKAVRVGEAYDSKKPAPPPDPVLAWWPTFAGIAQSGDLGFTTGPIEVGGQRRGHYFTVWKRQAGGGWTWIYDGGVGATSTDEPPASAQPKYLAASTAQPRYPEGALAAVKAEEARLATRAKIDQRQAMLAALAEDGRLHVPQRPPAKSPAAFAEALAAYGAWMDVSAPTGTFVSAAGDLAFTYGEARWEADGQRRTGWYAHIWQGRKDGWRLVFSQILPTRVG